MPVLERYQVQLLNGPIATAERWTVGEANERHLCQLLMGGSIASKEDWAHLRDDLKVTHVLSLETEHDDRASGVPDEVLLWLPTPDDGGMKQPAWFHLGWQFVLKAVRDEKARLYLHCQMGGSRTPLMLYPILRRLRELSLPSGPIPDWPKNRALNLIREVKPSFGTHHAHANYLASAEVYLAIADLVAA